MSFKIRKVNEKPRFSFPWKRFLIVALEFGRPVMGWYGSWKQRKNQEARRQKVLKRTLLVLVAILCAFAIFAVLAKGLLSMNALGIKTFTNITGIAPSTDEHGFVNVVVFGLGDGEQTGKDLTDAILVASVDAENTKSAVLLSLPRDLYFLHTEKMGAGRLNTFYRDYKSYLKYQEGMDEETASLEALKEVSDEIGRALGMPIHGVAKVNFTAFKQAVDMLGGIEVDVPYDIVDDRFPTVDYGYETFEIRQGLQRIDGETALKYARSRSTTSDFDRAARQQQVLSALAHKAKDEGLYKDPGAIIDFYKIFKENVVTSLGLGEIVGLAAIAKEIDFDRILKMQLNDRNGLYGEVMEPGGFLYTPPRDLFDGASVLLPVSIPEFPVTWNQIQTFKKLYFDTRSIHIAHPTIAVLNAGAPEGSARKLATELIRYGFIVDNIANASLDDQESSFITATEEHATKSTFFGTLLSMPISPFPSGLETEETRHVTIILGEDYHYAPFQSLISTE